jgi:hypothetical protein
MLHGAPAMTTDRDMELIQKINWLASESLGRIFGSSDDAKLLNLIAEHCAEERRELKVARQVIVRLKNLAQLRLKAARWLAEHAPGTPVPDYVDRAINISGGTQ